MPERRLLSAGRPSGTGCPVYHRRLTDRHNLRGTPNIIACGIGDASAWRSTWA